MPSDAPVPAPVPFFSLDPAGLDILVASWGWPKFRAQQLRDWVYRKSVADPDRMTNLAKRDRDTLRAHLAIAPATIAGQQLSADGTLKLLLDWGGNDKGNSIQAETVMIPDGDRRTACISSQVGCPVGCKFCASGMNGVKGNLTAGQIVEQVLALNVAMSGEGAAGKSEVRSLKSEGQDRASVRA